MGANFGHFVSEETKRKISETHKRNGHKPDNPWMRPGNNHPRFGTHHSEEHKQHIKEAHKRLYYLGLHHPPPSPKGKNANHWKGGKSKLSEQIMGTYQMRQWRADVFTRDNFTCQECGIKFLKRKGFELQAHHIKPKWKIIEEYKITTREEAIACSELWSINNGLTLCEDCHKKTDSYKRKKMFYGR